MTNPHLRTTYRPADGSTMPNGEVEPMAASDYLWGYLVSGLASDYIEEQWLEDTVVRWRTIRLGVDEECYNCDGDGKFVDGDTCVICHGSGVKPRDADPQWTEVEPSTTIDKEKSIEELRKEIVTIRLDRDAWIRQWTTEKNISDELYFFIKDNMQDTAKFNSSSENAKYKSSRGIL